MIEILSGQRRVLKNSKKTMYKIFVFLVSLIITSSAYASSELKILSKQLKNGELVKIQTYEAFSFYSLQEGWYKNTNSEFDALISYPKGNGPFPMVIIAHSSWGPEEFTSKWMKFHKDQHHKLLKMGIGTMFIDSYTSRGQKGSTASDQFTVSLWSHFIDHFMALEFLSKDPKVNIKKVGVTGHSRGGMISLIASEKRVRDALISKDLYFAAAQPRSPDCENVSWFRNPQPIKKTKTWMVLGEADNYTRSEPCIELGKKISSNGGNITVEVKKGWHHGFLGNYPPEREKNAQIFWKCPRIYTEDNGRYNQPYIDWMIEYGAFESEKEMYDLIKNDAQEAYTRSNIAYEKSKCMFLGAHTGGDKGRKFMKPYLKFWNDNLLN